MNRLGPQGLTLSQVFPGFTMVTTGVEPYSKQLGTRLLSEERESNLAWRGGGGGGNKKGKG